jgi:hypothetical protein
MRDRASLWQAFLYHSSALVFSVLEFITTVVRKRSVFQTYAISAVINKHESKSMGRRVFKLISFVHNVLKILKLVTTLLKEPKYRSQYREQVTCCTAGVLFPVGERDFSLLHGSQAGYRAHPA